MADEVYSKNVKQVGDYVCKKTIVQLVKGTNGDTDSFSYCVGLETIFNGILSKHQLKINLFIGIVCLMWIVWTINGVIHSNNYGYLHMVPQQGPQTSTFTERNFTILYYSYPSWFGNKLNSIDFFNDCDFKNCKVSFDHAALAESDAVIFYHSGMGKAPEKQRNQVWVFLTLEAPYTTTKVFNNADFKGKFDWTMTYRHDSEGCVPYGLVKPRSTVQKKNYTSIFLNKKKDVAWVVSHCSTVAKREKYAEELAKYMTVDIYGKCGKSCEITSAEECKKMLSKTYKFYLSFENSLCKDYLTEKITTIYLDDLDFIPVVRGAPNAGNYLPKNTFIMSSDFKSPHHLAKHLKMIGSNESYYISILKEKDKYYYKTNGYLQTGMCNICTKLNNGYKLNTTLDMDKWLWKSQCQNPTDI